MLLLVTTGGKYAPVAITRSIVGVLLMEDNLFQKLIKEDFQMLHAVPTGAYYPPVATTRSTFC